jgi:DNA-binding Lrp family transcriptional regulator
VIDALDARLLHLLTVEPRLPVLEAARRLGVARGTVQARLDRLTAGGIVDLAPSVDPVALGYPVAAYTTLEVAQGARAALLAELAGIPELLEASTVTGAGDLLLRLVARDTTHLQAVLDRVLALEGVTRSTTTVTLTTPLQHRVLPLVDAAAAQQR